MASSDELIGIKALSREGLADLIADLGEPRFRAKQLELWLYGRGAAGSRCPHRAWS